jgi:hypothetical protein
LYGRKRGLLASFACIINMSWSIMHWPHIDYSIANPTVGAKKLILQVVLGGKFRKRCAISFSDLAPRC